jgi:long-chain acyl-CoA synthetase
MAPKWLVGRHPERRAVNSRSPISRESGDAVSPFATGWCGGGGRRRQVDLPLERARRFHPGSAEGTDEARRGPGRTGTLFDDESGLVSVGGAAEMTLTNLALNLIEAARVYPDKPAICLDDNVVSYAALDEASAQLAGLLRAHGVAAGDRVGIMLPNVPEFAVVYYGVLRVGGIVVPMNPLLREREVEYYIGDSSAQVLFVWHQVADETIRGARAAGADTVVLAPGGLAEMLADFSPDPRVASRGGDDTAVVLYTSGTTGKPKGAELTHANLGTNAAVIARTLLLLAPEDVVMGCLPLFHSFGQTCALNAAVGVGATLTLITRFDPAQVLRVIARDRVTVFEGVPTMFAAMLGAPNRGQVDVSSLRVCISGGAALPVEVLRGFEQEFGCVILEGYGLSETSPAASFNHPHQERKVGSIGTPIEGVQMRVVDGGGREVPVGEVGEIAIRGHNIMRGYWRRPEATAEAIPDGWFRSGDLGRVDDDGYFFIVDRKKELIIRGGFNVYPREVEEVLYEHPAVGEAAVIGLPHESLGQEVAAAVALKPGAQATPEEIRDYVKGQVAPYKYPRHVWIVQVLPKTATGKILRREIRPPADLDTS